MNCKQSERVTNSLHDASESIAPLYLLIKDHKGWREDQRTPPPSRPVCSGLRGFNKHLSEFISLILEPIAHASGGAEVNSTGALLDRINKLNKQREENMLEEQLEEGRMFHGAKCVCEDENRKFNGELKRKRVKT